MGTWLLGFLFASMTSLLYQVCGGPHLELP